MFSSAVRQICILAFVIAPVLVFAADANGRTRLQLDAGNSGDGGARREEYSPPTAATEPTVVDAEEAAEATATGDAAPATLASSNAPATITNDVGGRWVGETGGGRQPEANDEVTTATVTTTMMRATAAATPLEETYADKEDVAVEGDGDGEEASLKAPRGAANTEVPTTNFGTKSRAPAAQWNGAVDVGDGDGGGNRAKTQIKNAKSQAPSASASASERTKDGVVGIAATSTTRAGLETTNEQETSTVANRMQAGAAPVASGAALMDINARPRVENLANTNAAVAAAHLPEEQQAGLYRIKSAEIVSDEFGGLPETEPALELATREGIATKSARAHTTTIIPTSAPTSTITTTTTTTTTREEREHEHQQEDHSENGEELGAPEAAAAPSRQNIADLYPLKMEDFNPIIRESNAKLLKERTVFTRSDDAEHRQNLLPNEVEVQKQPEQTQRAAAFGGRAAAATHVNRSPGVNRNSISDFTGKLLAEQDGIITEIEQKFRPDVYVVTDASASLTPATVTATATATAPATSSGRGASHYSHSVNHKIQNVGGGSGGGGGHDFIDRRVKKSFDFPMHRAASDVMALPHIDFANTKFNSDSVASAAKGAAAAAAGSAANGGKASANVMAAGAHPEFSTTKFYNSKELYNEMLLQSKAHRTKAAGATLASAPARLAAVALHANSKFETLPLFIETRSAATAATIAARRVTLTPSTSTTTTTTTTTRTTTTVGATPTAAATSAAVAVAALGAEASTAQPGRKYQKELKRAKLFLKAMFPAPIASVTTKDTNNNPNSLNSNSNATNTNKMSTTGAVESSTARISPASTSSTAALNTASSTSAAAASVRKASTTNTASTSTTAKINAATSFASSAATPNTTPTPTPTPTRTRTQSTLAAKTTTTARPLLPRRATNPTKSTSKPIARPRILSRLQEKINSLECDIQNVPQDSHLWRGNETHELLLPIVSPENCQPPADCTPLLVSWEGEAEIQSGDILIVEINDLLLHPTDQSYTNSAHTTQVYQVTRSGHEHCDVTEGILLDITPLVVDGRKLVTLYDKDLTEGVNLLIVVSELWGLQCVRLKVTTKTDNCGENSDCSGKGICYSNVAMEEYECQCCGGFAGPHCEEIDACTPSPCTNNGICVDLSQGHEGNSYQCLCPYGYTGKNCQYESDPCNPIECLNGGSCVGNSTHFRCDCTAGYTGPLCQHSLNECESSPCVHGICVDQEDGFRCFCQPGFAGELCNFEYNECESNPCQSGGECIDHIGSYECRCTKGYTGNRCQIKVDFCANNPCPEGHRCIDHGNDFGCECPGGRNGPDCNQMPRTQCNVNPCTHGGTCWSSGESFYCACRPGYTGTMCEDEFVVETVVSSSEFMVDDTSARNFNDKTFGSSVVLKSPIELHNAYFAAGVLAAAIFIVAIVVTICHCKVNQTYRKFSTRSTTFFPILGFGRRPKSQNKLNKHWLSGKGLGSSGGNPLRSSSSSASLSRGHLPATAAGNQYTTTGSTALHNSQLHERPFQRHLAMNLENDMYYTVDFSENSQHSPLIQ